MPAAAPTLCMPCAVGVHPCPTHGPGAEKRRSERAEETAERDRFYHTARWLRFRVWFLSLDPEKYPGWRCGPLCWDCKDAGRLATATDVDHIKRRSEGGADLDPHNCQSLCHRCHSRRTREAMNTEEAARGR